MRSGKSPKRKILPDPKFGSTNIAKFINQVMRKGKKSLAQRIVYKSFNLVAEKIKKEPLEIFDGAVKNVMPEVEVKSRRIGGATYQIPVAVIGGRKLSLAFRWIINAALVRKGMPMEEKLALELIDAYNKTGGAIKKKQDVYRMAEANRAFAHFLRR